MIQDSGNRREFESGAVRDVQEGKGRMDLLPLDVISKIFNNPYLEMIDKFLATKDTKNIEDAVMEFSEQYFPTPETALMELSIHYEEGAKKYSEYNWQKGIPCHCYIDSGLRHLMKFFRGDTDERHDRAFIWNMVGLLWTLKHKPELDDIHYHGSEKDLGKWKEAWEIKEPVKESAGLCQYEKYESDPLGMFTNVDKAERDKLKCESHR